jgi:hypothetical protein
MLQPPAIDGSKLAVLCTDGDEAGRWLRTWDVVAQGPLVIGCLLLSLLEGASRANLPALVDGVARSTLHLGLTTFVSSASTAGRSSSAWSCSV